MTELREPLEKFLLGLLVALRAEGLTDGEGQLARAADALIACVGANPSSSG